MPTHIKIFHAHDFTKVTPEGKLDLEQSKKLLIEIASASPTLADHAIILDTRKAHSEMSTNDLWDLAAGLNTCCKAFTEKTAVLCPVDRFDQAGFFALCAQAKGFQVRAFTSYEKAIEWLI